MSTLKNLNIEDAPKLMVQFGEMYDGIGRAITAEMIDERFEGLDEVYASKDGLETTNSTIAKIDDFTRSSLANALKGTQSGSIVVCDDVSPVQHIMTVSAFSKNMIDSSRLLLASGWTESNGVYSGNVVSLYNAFGVNKTYKLCEYKFKPNTRYTLSFKGYIEGDIEYGNSFVFDYDDGTHSRFYMTSKTEVEHTFVSDAGKNVVGFRVSYYKNGVTTYLSELQLEEGDTATEYTPFVDVSTVTLTRCGKNLAYPNLATYKVGGYTYTPNEDGSVTISGSATTTSEHVIPLALKDVDNNTVGVTLKANNTYTLSVTKDGQAFTGFGVKLGYANGAEKWSFDKTATQDRELLLVYVQFTPNVGDTDYCGTYRVQLELGNTATKYEPYMGAEDRTYTPNSDGTVDGVTSVSPIMVMVADTDNVAINVEYTKDTNKVIEKLIGAITALGGSV